MSANKGFTFRLGLPVFGSTGGVCRIRREKPLFNPAAVASRFRHESGCEIIAGSASRHIAVECVAGLLKDKSPESLLIQGFGYQLCTWQNGGSFDRFILLGGQPCASKTQLYVIWTG